ncbi:1-phosphofructokinase family hexose kinase [Microbacterium sp.]|uniref:1-phosphofructokinase family hexose kinase n=1 Tax=Microbacterium sp. TaxID=51671 RepID=UPI003F6EE32A
MIVTLTAHPALDRAIRLDAPLQPGEVQSATGEREDAGGKGINVARAVAAADRETIAVLPLAPDDPFDAALRATGIAARRVPVAGRTRTNLTITDPAGTTTKINLPGASLTGGESLALIAAVVDASAGARWLALAGSLPPGVDDDFYVEVIQAVRAAHGASAPLIAVDTSGAALRAVVDRAAPDLIKPNDEELAELAGGGLGGPDLPDAVLGIARTIVPGRARAALVTLGARGAILVTGDGAWSGAAPRIRVASTVGAGDSSLAGYLLAESEGAAPEERLRRAIRYGAAAASLAGTQAPRPLDLPSADVPVSALD